MIFFIGGTSLDESVNQVESSQKPNDDIPINNRVPTATITCDWEPSHSGLSSSLSHENTLKKHHKKWVVEMKEAMETERAKQLYKKRETTVEPVFGIIKGVLGFRAP